MWAWLDSNQRPIGYERAGWDRLLRETPSPDLARMAGVSKQYVSQVKLGQRRPSNRIMQALLQLHSNALPPSQPPTDLSVEEAISMFLQSRRDGISPETIREYRFILNKSLKVLGLTPSTLAINLYIRSLTCSPGGKYGYFKDLRAFYRWLYSPRAGLGFNPADNPITWVDPPKRPKLILPSLSRDQVLYLIDTVNSNRDKAIIAVFAESGLRLAELANVKETDINWQMRIIRTIGKGSKEGYAPFGALSEHYLKAWLQEYQSNGDTIWGMKRWAVSTMLKRLKHKTGLPCNPHTFRRTFACLLRKAGIDCLTIKDLGRWESVEMVQRYTASITFFDSLKFYKAPLSRNESTMESEMEFGGFKLL